MTITGQTEFTELGNRVQRRAFTDWDRLIMDSRRLYVCLEALRSIAAGHPDGQTVARVALAEIGEGEHE
jgi:hypothetical protein